MRRCNRSTNCISAVYISGTINRKAKLRGTREIMWYTLWFCSATFVDKLFIYLCKYKTLAKLFLITVDCK